ncbi:MAG: DUF4149 domain-containing protein [Methylophilaceae bacterium]|nr:DUF4149 domain-containing protein [Methylophilaceae bacterium]
MSRLADHLAVLLMTAWVGGLWAIGYLAAPVLFHTLDDRQLAGVLAGKMFAWIAYFGVFCAFYLLIHRIVSDGTRALRQGCFWVIMGMLLLTLAGQFGIQPVLAQLKVEAGAMDVMQSVFADRFRTWHGVASIGYLIESLLGVVLVLKFR